MSRRTLAGILLATAAVAAVTARPYAGGWNDGSRLAAVESLVDRHTFAIDDSVYVTPAAAARPPYAPGDEPNARFGTRDKLYIDGHFYSDKSPVPAVLMAGAYQLWRWAGGPAAADRPDGFARFLTWVFAGLPFVLAVGAVGRLTRSVGVPAPWDGLLTAGFALGTLGLPYTQHVNNHVLLLAVAAGVCEAAVRRGPRTASRAAWLGLLAGFGYTIDLGAGPALAVAGLVLWPGRGGRPAAAFLAALAPWVAAHHALNYAVAGMVGPANANPEFFRWPGSPFHEGTMTGVWSGRPPGGVFLYGLDLLFGKKGVVTFTPPLVLAVLGAPWLLGRRSPERPALVALAAWAAATWLAYAVGSRGASGVCLSVRWLVPLVAPGFLALGVLARDFPVARRPLAILLAAGLVMNLELVGRGPNHGNVPLTLWPVFGLSVAAAGAAVLSARLPRPRLTPGRGPLEPSPGGMTG